MSALPRRIRTLFTFRTPTNLFIIKFSTVTHAALFTAAISVLGQKIISPTPGQVLPANASFNLTHASERYFRENSVKISVVTAPIGGGFPGGPPVLELAPTSRNPRGTSAIYSVMFQLITLYTGDPTGNHTVYVIEVYDAFGVG
ncbi:hypothetical protein B0H13DRAFT_1887855 [Mycena leptocephala]|nr:hypothetical protein B0H13DRAFT_1887855 [Mycena leptocephala]